MFWALHFEQDRQTGFVPSDSQKEPAEAPPPLIPLPSFRTELKSDLLQEACSAYLSSNDLLLRTLFLFFLTREHFGDKRARMLGSHVSYARIRMEPVTALS